MNTTAHKTINALLTLLLVSFSGYLHAGSPVWTFLPLTPTSISVSSSDIATIQYQVTNQSKKSHTLEMKAISGISQNTTLGNCANPFTLGYQQSCILTLTIDGSAIQGGIDGGPVVCQQGNALQCYQPSSADALSIRLMTAPGATTLSASVSTLGLSVNCQLSGGCPPRTPTQNIALTGTPRLITITNTGSYAATDVTYSPSPALPSGTTISPANCGTIAASDTCVLTITPGSTASATPGVTSPTSITLSISGMNTNTLTPTLNVLTYGSVYQGGYIYAVDDNTPDTGSIGGKVAGLINVSNINQWTSALQNISGAQSSTNGTQNTSDIVASTSCANDISNCAAYQCRINFTDGGNTDWYLPAICEMGYGIAACGDVTTPTLQNMQSNLVNNGNVGSLSGGYWSSSEFLGDPTNFARYQLFASGGSSNQNIDSKSSIYGVRCSRALTL